MSRQSLRGPDRSEDGPLGESRRTSEEETCRTIQPTTLVILCFSFVVVFTANACWAPPGFVAGGVRRIYLMENLHHYHTQPGT